MSKPTIQIYGVKTFETVIAPHLKKQGYSLGIVHNPKEHLSANAAKAAKAREVQAKEKKEAEEKKFQDAVNAASELAAQKAVDAYIASLSKGNTSKASEDLAKETKSK